MSRLFISYAHADSIVVNEVWKQLQEAGHEVWIDTQGIQFDTPLNVNVALLILKRAAKSAITAIKISHQAGIASPRLKSLAVKLSCQLSIFSSDAPYYV